ncbi:MBL fold metallo-hydrolase, partial [Proteus mirabilis]
PKAIDKRFIYSAQVTERQIHKRYGFIVTESSETDDDVLDDSFLIWQGQQGLVSITGCRPSGIDAIIRHAKKIKGNDKIQA